MGVHLTYVIPRDVVERKFMIYQLAFSRNVRTSRKLQDKGEKEIYIYYMLGVS